MVKTKSYSGSKGVNGKSPTTQNAPVDAFDSLKQDAKSYGFILDESMRAYPVHVVQDIVREGKEVFDEFKGIELGFAEFHARPYHDVGGYGSARYDGVVKFPDRYFGSDSAYEFYETKRKGDYLDKFHPNGSRTTHHELGHIIEATLIRREVGISGNNYSIMDYIRGGEMWHKGVIAKDIVSTAIKKVRKTPYGKRPDGKPRTIMDLRESVSGYAKKNYSETLAECVADYMVNKNNANPLSIAVAAETKRRLAQS